MVSITLVTGDRVRLTTRRNARPTVAVTAGAGRREAVVFSTRYDGDRVYVVPSDAVAPLAAGQLDERLFDVTGLARDGHAGKAAGETPLIARYASGSRAATATPQDVTTRAGLAGLNAVALSTRKPDAGAYWRWLTTTGFRSGVQKVWLDGRVRGALNRSVPQIGAPQAWELGLTGGGVKVAVLGSTGWAGRRRAGSSRSP